MQITPAPQDWHRADIKAALEKRGLPLSRLARSNGYARGSASTALLIQWPKMERLIAAAIGLQPQEIWPTRYNKDGEPMPRGTISSQQRTLKNTTGIGQGNVDVRRRDRRGPRSRSVHR
jgi:Ner family transcriptional regulator